MNLPRGVSGDRLIRALERLGYAVTRQKGSHVRLRHDGPPAHADDILAEVALVRSISIVSISIDSIAKLL